MTAGFWETLQPQGDFTRVLRRLPTELNNNLPVPVLAEPEERASVMQRPSNGEARESTESDKPRKNDHRSLERVAGSDSRDGQNNFSQSEPLTPAHGSSRAVSVSREAQSASLGTPTELKR